MKYYYASRTGNVQALVGKLGIEAVQIEGSEEANEDYILFTYTDGYGDVPPEVESFLANNGAHIKGVVVSGDTSYGEAYCGAAEKINEAYGAPILYKVENDGTDEDVAAILSKIA